MTDKAWGGRFEKSLDEEAAKFSASVDVDHKLAAQDIRGSLAHVRMLRARGILSSEDAERIEAGLAAIAKEIQSGTFPWDPSREDVHMNIEAALSDRVGEAGGRLHTARSRNDQVATDLRLWTRESIATANREIDELLRTLVHRARETVSVLMPGYTHLQRAQPVRMAHHLLAWAEMLLRDRGRLVDAAVRLNESPLGAGALATTTFPIDRELTALELGFDRPTQNSLDTVADRDFVVETVSALAICAVHLSRIAEELVLWSTQEFGFVHMSDAFSTGSSMMPQKKNPDMAELIRGKSGRVVGDLVSLLVLLKGLPLSYNRDLQEDKAPLFDAFETVIASLRVLRGTVDTLVFDETNMRLALREGFLEATEIADYLAARGVPFRDAHHVAGRLVRLAVESRRTLSELTLDELRAENAAFEADVASALDPERIVERRDVIGGPARAQVERQIERLSRLLDERAEKG